MNDYDVNEKKKEVEKIAFEMAREFNLNLTKLEWLRTDFLYGMAYRDGKIVIKIQFTDGELVPETELWRTVAHELAHLRYMNHNEEFWRFNKEILAVISEKIGIKVPPEVALFNVRERGSEGVIA